MVIAFYQSNRKQTRRLHDFVGAPQILQEVIPSVKKMEEWKRKMRSVKLEGILGKLVLI